MKIFTNSLLKLFILSAMISLFLKPVFSDETEEGMEPELMENDLEEMEEEEEEELDAEIEEESAADDDLFEEDGEDEDEEDDFIMHKGRLIEIAKSQDALPTDQLCAETDSATRITPTVNPSPVARTR